jgi:hypothetical protein
MNKMCGYGKVQTCIPLFRLSEVLPRQTFPVLFQSKKYLDSFFFVKQTVTRIVYLDKPQEWLFPQLLTDFS